MLGLVVYGGISLFLSGLIIAAYAVITRKRNRGWEWQLGEGVLDIIMAVVLLLNIGLTAVSLPFVFAFYGMLTGLFWIFQSVVFRKNKYQFWPVAFIAGLFSLLIGIIIFYRPVLAALTIVGIIGIMFMMHGFFILLFSFEISGSKMRPLKNGS